MIVDAQARQRAIDMSRNILVQAPAGSGKTELLIQRVLTALTMVQRPEEVLAITFTKKAAQEMQERIIASLYAAQTRAHAPTSEPARSNYRIAKKVLARDTELNWSLLVNKQRLNITTIDSLCYSIVKKLPTYSKLVVGFEPSDDPDPLYYKAVQYLFAMLDDGTHYSKHLFRLFDAMDDQKDRVAELLVDLLKRRDQWLQALIPIQVDANAVRAQLESTLGYILSNMLKKASDVFVSQGYDYHDVLCSVLELSLIHI